MKKGLLIYKDIDYGINREFAQRFTDNCFKFGLKIDLVLESGLKYGIYNGKFYVNYCGLEISHKNYEFAVNRTRNAYIALVLENLGIRVFNSSKVTALCNDKNLAYIHAAELKIPCLDTYIYTVDAAKNAEYNYPVVIKQPFSHGGQKVFLCSCKAEVFKAAESISGEYVTVQQMLQCQAVNDIRVYVMGNSVIGAVKRTAEKGFKANYCKGGSISLFEPDEILLEYVNKLLEYEYYDFVGIDFLYNGSYYFNEIEDAVGSRSLCELKNIDTSMLYLEYISKQLKSI